MTAALATVETLQHLTGKRFGCLLDFSMFVNERTGRCYPPLKTIAGASVERVSESTMCRAMALFVRLGLVTRKRDEITDAYDYDVEKHYLPAFLEARRIHRPDYRVRRRKTAKNQPAPSCSFASQSISESFYKPESCFLPFPEKSESVAAREEGFSENDGGILAGIDASATPEAESRPSDAVVADQPQNPEPSSEPSPADDPPAAEGTTKIVGPLAEPEPPSREPHRPDLDAEPPESLPHAGVNPPPGRSGFVPIHCRHAVPPEERARRYDLLKNQKIPRLLGQLPQPSERKSAYWLELMNAPDAAAERVIVDRYASAFDSREYDIDHVPLHEWKVREGIPVKPWPPHVVQAPAPTPDQPPKSKADQYRQSMRIVAEELARRRAQP